MNASRNDSRNAVGLQRMVLSRRNWIGLLVLTVALFVIAEVTYKSTVSNVMWGGFLIGAALLILLAVIALVRSRRPAR